MTTKSKVPQIRFKGFSGEWETKELGEIGSVAMNKRIFKNQTTEKGDIPFYKIGTFGGNADAFISRQLFEDYKSKYPYPKKGDLLISASGSIGRIVEYTGKDEYFQDSNIVWLKHENQLENSFLKQFYKVVKWNGLEGSTIQRLYNKNILETQISFPKERTEQTKIGDYFQQLDKLIEQKEKKYQKLKQFKKAMLDKMFPKNGADTPEIRFKGFSSKWEEKSLSELIEYKNGKGHEDKQTLSGKYELINLNSISIDGGLKHSGKFVNETESTLNENDLVMVLSDVGHGDLLGRVALIPENNKFVLNQRVALLRPFNNIIPQFLFYNINVNQKYFKMQGAGMSQLNISKSSVESFISYIPSDLKEQQKIGNYFQKLDSQIDLQQKELEKLKNIKKASLSKMFV